MADSRRSAFHRLHSEHFPAAAKRQSGTFGARPETLKSGRSFRKATNGCFRPTTDIEPTTAIRTIRAGPSGEQRVNCRELPLLPAPMIEMSIGERCAMGEIRLRGEGEQMRYLALVVFLIALGLPQEAWAQINCDDVLSYTGRQHDIFGSREIGERYHQSRSASSQGLDVAFRGISGGWSENRSRSASSGQSWDNSFFREVDSVYAPAIQAWSQCMIAAQNNVRLRGRLVGRDNRQLEVDITPPSGMGVTLNGVSSSTPGIACTLNDRPISAQPIDLPSGASNLTCRRTSESRDEANVRILLRAGNYDFTMPAVPAPGRSYRDRDSESRSIDGCATAFVLPAVSYPREILISDIVMYGLWQRQQATGFYRIWINDALILDRTQNGRPQGVQVRGPITATPIEYEIPAFVPALVRVLGSVDNMGSCERANATLVLPSRS